MEELTKDMPEPGDKSITITAFVDISHELDKRKKNITYRVCDICKQVPNYIL